MDGSLPTIQNSNSKEEESLLLLLGLSAEDSMEAEVGNKVR